MKHVIIKFLMLIRLIYPVSLLPGCGFHHDPEATQPIVTPVIQTNKMSCSVSQTTTMVTIICPDNTQASYPIPTPSPAIVSPPPVTVVQLCEGSPTQYPEQAVCIFNQLYGVYWDGQNAWLTLLPPGNYRSTSSFVPCNLAVEADCKVSH